MVEIVNLTLGQPGPPTEGFMVMSSDMAIGDRAHLEVSEFPNLRVEVAADGLSHRHGSIKHLWSVGEGTVHVRDLAEFLMQAFQGGASLVAGLLVPERVKVGHALLRKRMVFGPMHDQAPVPGAAAQWHFANKLESSLLTPRPALLRSRPDVAGWAARRINIISPVDDAGCSTRCQDPECLSQQSDGVLDVQDV